MATVSSKPQRGPDKFSIPNQIKKSRSVIERHGWREAHEPLVVPGQSRTQYISLTEAMQHIGGTGIATATVPTTASPPEESATPTLIPEDTNTPHP
ncbi:MAG TPA: hypothetical protein VJ020_12280 [Anaerolineales bacterium]|nr:hypothetical protein [Anaerolineales bacterium]